ncbi:hypothetical protein MOKP76_38580 [Mycobacterium avium subsp. hominissuis]
MGSRVGAGAGQRRPAQLLRVLARRLRCTNDALCDLIFTDVPGRVSKQLLELKGGDRQTMTTPMISQATSHAFSTINHSRRCKRHQQAVTLEVPDRLGECSSESTPRRHAGEIIGRTIARRPEMRAR